MERAVSRGDARQLGLSNVTLRQLRKLSKAATIQPMVVQQRFYHKTGFEREMREWCGRHNVFFQSFWTLTANSKNRPGSDAIISPTFRALAEKYRVAPEVLFYRFVLGEGMIPMNGTTNLEHMEADLKARLITLEDEDARAIDALLGNM